MQKKIGAILLVAGTCIGSGMIALPMVLSKLGLVSSVLVMLFIWFITYYSSLINLELNLQAGGGLTLGALGRRYSGRIAEWIGTFSLKILSYLLLAVFIYGGSSVLQKLFASKLGTEYAFSTIATCYAVVVLAMLLLPIKFIDYTNRLLFTGLVAVVALLLADLVLKINWSNLPLLSEEISEVSIWAAIIPVVFTSFGFQSMFHSMTGYCNNDVKTLKQAVFWGSIIPAIVYILWTCSILSVVYHDSPLFYAKMASGKAEVGELIQVLGSIAKSQSVQVLVWWTSSLAIATSVIGVGIGLFDSIKWMMPRSIPQQGLRRVLSALITVLPAYLVVIFVPNAFISVLGFAGMILAVIAILLPIYLFWELKPQQYHYRVLKWNTLILMTLAFGLIVIICELYNML